MLSRVKARLERRAFTRRYPLAPIELNDILKPRTDDLEVSMPKWSTDLRAGNIQDSFVFASLVTAYAPKKYFEIGTGD